VDSVPTHSALPEAEIRVRQPVLVCCTGLRPPGSTTDRARGIEPRESAACTTLKDSGGRRGATSFGKRCWVRRCCLRRRRNEPDHLRDRQECRNRRAWDGLQAPGHKQDDVVVVGVVVEAADPRLVRRAGLGERGQYNEYGQQDQDRKPSQRHGPQYTLASVPHQHVSPLLCSSPERRRSNAEVDQRTDDKRCFAALLLSLTFGFRSEQKARLRKIPEFCCPRIPPGGIYALADVQPTTVYGRSNGTRGAPGSRRRSRMLSARCPGRSRSGGRASVRPA